MQDRIIYLLFENQGEFISGRQLACKLDISTVAVWKRIRNLIEKGYEIEALQKKGYRLINNPTCLWPSGYKIPKTKWLPNDIAFNVSVSSTMDIAKREYKDGRSVIALAREQTSGRGRHKRSWLSATDAGIYMTVTVKPDFSMNVLPLINLASSVAISRLLDKQYNIHTKIKWPNDIFFNGKKISGILIETETEGNELAYLAIGIGIDLYDNGIYGSLSEAGSYINPIEFVSLIIRELDIQLENIIMNPEYLLSYWRLNNNTIGNKVIISGLGGIVSGIAKDIDSSGYLIVEESGGKLSRVISGDLVLEGV